MRGEGASGAMSHSVEQAFDSAYQTPLLSTRLFAAPVYETDDGEGMVSALELNGECLYSSHSVALRACPQKKTSLKKNRSSLGTKGKFQKSEHCPGKFQNRERTNPMPRTTRHNDMSPLMPGLGAVEERSIRAAAARDSQHVGETRESTVDALSEHASDATEAVGDTDDIADPDATQPIDGTSDHVWQPDPNAGQLRDGMFEEADEEVPTGQLGGPAEDVPVDPPVRREVNRSRPRGGGVGTPDTHA